MPKYKIKHTTILHNGSTHGEGTEIELTKAQAERLADFVELIPEPKTPKPQPPKTNQNKDNSGITPPSDETKEGENSESSEGAKNDK